MDTVIIKLFSPNKFIIRNRSLFLPELTKRKYMDLSPTERLSKNPYLRRFVLKPKKYDGYLPSVEVFETLTKDRKEIRYVLKIEFSLPKLLYSNSILEVTEKDFEKACIKLKFALESVDIEVSIEDIKNATVSAVHVCKNVILPKTIKMREVLDKINKLDISKSFDISDRQYKWGGRVVNFHSGTIDWTFYDKISDCMRPKNKRSDKNYIDPEREFVRQYNLTDTEIFRYEYRIKKTQTLKRELNNLLNREYKNPIIFRELFIPDLLTRLLLNSWSKITERPENTLSLFYKVDNLELLMHILNESSKLSKSGHSLNNAFISYGLTLAIRDNGAKEVRGAIFDRWNNDHPERLSKKIKLASQLTQNLPRSDSINFIDRAIKKLEFITLIYLKNVI